MLTTIFGTVVVSFCTFYAELTLEKAIQRMQITVNAELYLHGSVFEGYPFSTVNAAKTKNRIVNAKNAL